MSYKSKTDVLLARIKSFNLIQKANVKYTPNHNPAVTKDIYIKNRRTLVTRIPNLSANLEDTWKPYFSKKNLSFIIADIFFIMID
jgi:hypothetical protein